MNPWSWLPKTSPAAARRLLGCVLIRQIGEQTISVRVVETEAYDQSDPASHSFRGPTPRNQVMFGSAGHLYVYFTYGMHYCCNVVVGPAGHAGAVLIRAVEPLDAASELVMAGLRLHPTNGPNLSNGPAKLCQALAINQTLNGHDLAAAPLTLVSRPAMAAADMTETTRIGIKQAVDQPWRFYITGHPYISRS